MPLSLFYRLVKLNSMILVAISVLLSEVLTSLMSFILRGRITYDYLITGGVVSLIVSGIVVYFIRRVSRLSEDNEILKKEIINRKKTEEALKESEAKFRLFLEYSPVYVFFKDKNLRAIHLSRNFEEMLGRPVNELLGKTMDELFPSDLAKSMVEDDLRILREGKPLEVEEEFNGRIYFTLKFPIILEGNPSYLAGFTMDITERRQMEAEREKLIADLKEALAKVKTLRGMLPICSHCRKIRDDKGYWKQIETYIHEHSETEFSHGICPDCVKKFYPEHYDNIIGQESK